MKARLKKYIPWIIGIFIVVFYFEYAVSITWDSAHYMSYVSIFEGNSAWSSWDVVRGPVFPVIIYFGNVLFGKTAQGLIMNTFCYYIIMLVFVYKILKYVLSKYKKKTQKILIFIILFFIVINPIVYGFYHTLLTEFVAITLAIISCYLAILWLDMDVNINRKKYIIISIIFSILTVIAWFLKQPYLSCGFFALFVAYIISIIQNRNLKNFLFRTGTVALCLIVLIIGIKSWNYLLLTLGNEPDSSRNPTVSLGNQLIRGVYFLEIEDSTEIFNEQYIQDSKLDKSEKKQVLKLLAKDENYLIVNIYDDSSQIVESDYLISNDGSVGISSAVIYIIQLFFDRPLEVLDAYFVNYLSIIDIYSTETNDGANYKSSRKIDWSFSNELNAIAGRPYGYGNVNIFAMTSQMYERVFCYEQTNYVFVWLNYVMILLSKIYLLLFKIMFLLLPIFLILVIIFRIIKGNLGISKKILNLIIILFGFSFLHMMLHTITGAIIDRYAIPAFLTVYLGFVLLALAVINKIDFRKIIKRDNNKRIGC